MMPSSYKNQQQPAPSSSSNGTVTTTVTTTTAAAPSAKFTQAELGSRSLARSIDRKMQEMSKQQSEIGNSVLDQVLAREKKDIAEDRTFGSTSTIEDIPDKVMKIILAHDIFQDQIIRMIHIPGASYFSVAHQTDQGKEYSTFSLDEVIDELENENEDIAEEVPEPSVDTESVAKINTLGTISAEPVTNTFVNTSVQLPEPETQPTTETKPTSVRIPITEISEPVEGDHNEPKIIIAPFEPVQEIKKEVQSFDQVRMAMARDFETYYSSHYKDHITGTFNQLFGSNPDMSNSLFKTITDYNKAKELFLRESGKGNPTITFAIDNIRREELLVAGLLNHKKSLLFAKLMQRCKIVMPSVIETRNRIIGTADVFSDSPLSQKLGIHGLMKNEPTWKKLFSNSSEKLKSIISVAPEVVSDTIPTVTEIKPETAPNIEKKVNRKKLYDFLHVNISKYWNINQNNQEKIIEAPEPALTATQSMNNPVIQSVDLSPVIGSQTQIIQESVIKPVPITETAVPATSVPLSFSPDNKQHPEHLFN